MAITTLTTNNTFFEWLTATNQIISYVNTDTGNAGITQANAAYNQANLVFDYANAAYTRANVVWVQANAAYSQANLVFGQANSAYVQANLVFGQANAAYTQANLVFGQANLVFGQANSAYDKANAANVLAFGKLSSTGPATFTGNLTIAGWANSTYINVATQASNSVTSVVRFASGSEFTTGTSRALALGVADVWDSAAEVSVADGATITLNLSTGINFNVNVSALATRTLATPTNMKPGQGGYIRIKQGGPTAQTFSSFGAGWNFAGGTTPTLSTGTGNTDLLFYQVLSTANVFGSLVKDIRVNY